MIEFALAFYNFSAFEKKLPSWENLYRGDPPDYDLFDDPAEAYEFLHNTECAVLLFHVKSKQDLPGLVKLLKKKQPAIRKGKLKVFGINDVDEKKIQKIFKKLKVEDILQRNDLNARTFKFKVDLWKRTMLKALKKDSEQENKNVKAASENKKTEQKTSQHKIVPEKPLEMDADQWIVKANQDCKYVLRKWNVIIMGPSPYVGKWEDTGKKDKGQSIWLWRVSEKADEIFQDTDGHWYFLGEKPEYLWNEDRWLFKASEPRLFFIGKQDKGLRFFVKEGDLHLAKNSQIALTKEPYIIESFEQNIEAGKQEQEEHEEEVEDNDEDQTGHLKGKGKTDHLDHSDLEGDVQESEDDLGGHYKGDVEEQLEEAGDLRGMDKSQAPQAQEDLKGLVDKSTPEYEEDKDRQATAADSFEDLKGLEEKQDALEKEDTPEHDARADRIQKYYNHEAKDVGLEAQKEEQDQKEIDATDAIDGRYRGSAKDSLNPHEQDEEQEDKNSSSEKLATHYGGSAKDSLDPEASSDDPLQGEQQEGAERRQKHYRSAEHSGLGEGAQKDAPEWSKEGGEDHQAEDLRGLSEEEKATGYRPKKTQNLAADHQRKEHQQTDLDISKDVQKETHDPEQANSKDKPNWSKEGGEDHQAEDLRGLVEHGQEAKKDRPSGEIEEQQEAIKSHYRSDQSADPEDASEDSDPRQAYASDRKKDLSGEVETAAEKREGHYKGGSSAEREEESKKNNHENISERHEGHYRNPDEHEYQEERKKGHYGGASESDEDIDGYYRPGANQKGDELGGHYDSRTGEGKKKNKGHEFPIYEVGEGVHKKRRQGYDIIDENVVPAADGVDQLEGFEEGMDNLELLEEARQLAAGGADEAGLSLESAHIDAVLFQKKPDEPNSMARGFEVRFDDVFKDELTLVAPSGSVVENHDHRIKLVMNYQLRKSELVLDIKFFEKENTSKGEDLLVFKVVDYSEEKIEKFLAPQRERQKNINRFVKLATGTD